MKFWMVALVLVLAIGFVASPVLACDPDGSGGGNGGNGHGGGGCGGHGGHGGHKCDPNDDGHGGGGCGGCPTGGH